MTCSTTIAVLLSVLVNMSSGIFSCGINEILDKCPSDCAYDYCPKHELQDRTPCPKPEVCPPPACKCGFNYRRAENGTCIPTTECPPFECSRVNEEFNPCPFYCPSDNCDDATPFGECPFFLLIVNNCSPSCRCIRNYWRKDGVCVPFNECPNIIKANLNNEALLNETWTSQRFDDVTSE
ncbi:inducible metalloproteinase inhibitor protein-like [Vanessa cardui]|uniref:inducible metalloproteinase inhibitor protein-like n=1 Tax=Vanessa cardui TaxID=171605 RepID=UPI001F149243|nr:inducible metalloproteinase inhibitor protein-like [Vanessa cardui]